MHGATEGSCRTCHPRDPVSLSLSPPADPPLRLAGGRSRCEGRVEVRHQGVWGTVCDDHWDIRDARVVCRLLRCGPALAAPGRGRFGPGSGPILLDDVRCAGTEDALDRCGHSGWTRHNCRHREDAGVVCTGAAARRRSGLSPGLRPSSSARVPKAKAPAAGISRAHVRAQS